MRCGRLAGLGSGVVNRDMLGWVGLNRVVVWGSVGMLKGGEINCYAFTKAHTHAQSRVQPLFYETLLTFARYYKHTLSHTH